MVPKKNRKITGLLACDPKGVIGKKGKLPWHYPEELDFFRTTTHHQIMVMGRKTYQAIPQETLKNRFNVVFSRRFTPLPHQRDYVVPVSSMDEFQKLELPFSQGIYMIGGGEIANLFLKADLIDDFLLTKIHKIYEGDTYFSLDLLKDWPQNIIQQKKEYTICLYTKTGAKTQNENHCL